MIRLQALFFGLKLNTATPAKNLIAATSKNSLRVYRLWCTVYSVSNTLFLCQ
jgi:hypothetical protein